MRSGEVKIYIFEPLESPIDVEFSGNSITLPVGTYYLGLNRILDFLYLYPKVLPGNSVGEFKFDIKSLGDLEVAVANQIPNAKVHNESRGQDRTDDLMRITHTKKLLFE
ncbi:hypothetical protein KY308_02490 [Candidatus Woesearchaeota archaeon]|nr:hypothetical protein [Candidatus Woesearchaeota archaeon]